ncbi:MAG: excinuclease ABC subunit UvrC [Lachnospiraceae bacterium]|nr:excinuclease ABC subunit UvrC [Lachnospiraceae bacterium]
MEFNIQEELKKLPAKPGVYIMHNADDEIIYVGKAVVLKNRVRQYFQSNKNHTAKVRKMVSCIAWFEYIVVDSEMEALVLECNLIKEHRPKYNTMLKDDKHYPYIKVTTGEDFPRIFMARERKKDNAEYFGPYTSADSVHRTIDLLRKTCGIRNCSKRIEEGEKVCERPCLYHSMGQCPAPCMGDVKREEYKKGVERCLSFLRGHHEAVTDALSNRMLMYSENLEFERAAEMRDLINSVKRLDQAQKADECDDNDRDIVAVVNKDDTAVASCFFIRNGKLTGREHFYLTGVENETREKILESFIKQYYSGTPHIPREIYISKEIEDAELISGWLSEIRGSKVTIFTPKKGEKLKLTEMAENNARTVLFNDEKRIRDMEKRTSGALNEIKNLLKLEKLYRIESYDISNTAGFENVASMVVFEGGKPKKSDYRRFKTKTIIGADDYGSMREVLRRRFEHGLRELKEAKEKNEDSFVRFPDLLLIDGGRGQVNSVLEVVGSLGLDIPVCGMVKDDRHRTRGLWFNDEEVPIDTYSEGFKLVTRIQDETHRFAIEYHKTLRNKAQTRSILDDIPNVGQKRRIEIMRHFNSLEELKNADVEKLAELPSMNLKAAESIWEFLHPSENRGKEE